MHERGKNAHNMSFKGLGTPSLYLLPWIVIEKSWRSLHRLNWICSSVVIHNHLFRRTTDFWASYCTGNLKDSLTCSYGVIFRTACILIQKNLHIYSVLQLYGPCITQIFLKVGFIQMFNLILLRSVKRSHEWIWGKNNRTFNKYICKVPWILNILKSRWFTERFKRTR